MKFDKMPLQRWKQLFKTSWPFVPEATPVGNMIPSLADIPRMLTDRKMFDETLYTHLDEAWEELTRRRQDKDLERRVNEILGNDIPLPFSTDPKAVLFRHVLTPNYETRRFVSLLDGFGKIDPLFWEYHKDKYTPNNELKRTIGRLFFYHGKGKKGGMKLDSLNVLDFNTANGKPISSLQTSWGQDFVQFHHDFFADCFRPMPGTTFDASDWFQNHGGSSGNYYKSFMALFIRHGILFENMMLDDSEVEFARDVFLPAFLEIFNELGVKPLIVALEPTNIEGDHFWMCYPGQDKEYVEKRMKG